MFCPISFLSRPMLDVEPTVWSRSEIRVLPTNPSTPSFVEIKKGKDVVSVSMEEGLFVCLFFLRTCLADL